MNPEGIIIRPSQYSVKETIDRLQTFLQAHGATLYARINQQSEVNKAGQHLFPLEVILFGNPKAGGPLMAENPLVALDLPLKVIAWQDDQQKVWIAYNDAAHFEDRYALQHSAASPLALDKVILAALKAFGDAENY